MTHEWLKNEEKIEKKLIEYILRYISLNKNLRIAVAFRPQINDLGKEKEFHFFSKYLSGLNINYIEHDTDSFSTYKTMEASKVIVANISTCAFEAMGWGKRVLFIQPYEFNLELPEDLYYSVRSPNYNKTSLLIDELLSISDEQYSNNVNNNINEYCYNNTDNKPHEIMLQSINSFL